MNMKEGVLNQHKTLQEANKRKRTSCWREKTHGHSQAVALGHCQPNHAWHTCTLSYSRTSGLD